MLCPKNKIKCSSSSCLCAYEKGIDSFVLEMSRKRLYQEHVTQAIPAKWKQSGLTKGSRRKCSQFCQGSPLQGKMHD